MESANGRIWCDGMRHIAVKVRSAALPIAEQMTNADRDERRLAVRAKSNLDEYDLVRELSADVNHFAAFVTLVRK